MSQFGSHVQREFKGLSKIEFDNTVEYSKISRMDLKQVPPKTVTIPCDLNDFEVVIISRNQGR